MVCARLNRMGTGAGDFILLAWALGVIFFECCLSTYGMLKDEIFLHGLDRLELIPALHCSTCAAAGWMSLNGFP